jgi:hypothetical protein
VTNKDCKEVSLIWILSFIFVLVTIILTACSDDSARVSAEIEEPVRSWRSDNVVPLTYGFQSIWGSSPMDIFAVGISGSAVRGTGGTWSRMDAGTTRSLYFVWGTGPDDVFAIGDAYLHFDGSSWEPVTPPTNRRLRAVWGATSSNLFFVGDYGTILHFDGAAWSDYSVDDEHHFGDIWGSGRDDIYAATVRGLPYHYDGNSWTLLDTGFNDPPLLMPRVAGSSKNQVMLAGYSSLFLDNGYWSYKESTSGVRIEDLWCDGKDDYYAVTRSHLLRFDGQEWRQVFSIEFQFGHLMGVWGDGRGNIYLAASNGGIWHHRDGRTELINKSLQDIKDIWGSSVRSVFAVGDRGSVLKFDGEVWSVQEKFTTDRIRSVWGRAADDVYAIDSDDVFHYNGRRWNSVYHLTSGGFEDIWGTDRGDCYVVGYGSIVHNNAGKWEAIRANLPLTSVWGTSGDNVIAAGWGACLHFDGQDWVVVDGPEDFGVYDLWGFSQDRVYAAGAGGAGIARFDGGGWTVPDDGPYRYTYCVWGRSENDLFLISDHFVHHFDGAEWDWELVEPRFRLQSLWGFRGGEVLVGGMRGLLMRYTEDGQ